MIKMPLRWITGSTRITETHLFCCSCISKRRILSSNCITLNPILVHAVESRADLAGSKTCFLTPTKRQIIITLTSSDLTCKSSKEPPTDKKTVETVRGYWEQGVNLMVIDQGWKVTRGGRDRSHISGATNSASGPATTPGSLLAAVISIQRCGCGNYSSWWQNSV